MISDFLLSIAVILFAYSIWKIRSKKPKNCDAKGVIGIFYASQGGTAAKLSDILKDSLDEQKIKSEILNIREFDVN